VGKDAIRKYVSDAFATPGFSITWQTDKVEVAQSGDLAYSTGTDRMSLNGPDGKSVTEESRGVAIWKKQPDGSWKCVVDVMSPAAPLDVK
jgi:ketosteroid isomerase-like protein